MQDVYQFFLQEQIELVPLFTTELFMEPQALLFYPGLDDFDEGLGEVIKRFQDAVLSVMNLVPDSYFDAFTRYNNNYVDPYAINDCKCHLKLKAL
jgi:hypothetical protein